MALVFVLVWTFQMLFVKKAIRKPDLTGGQYESSLCDSESRPVCSHRFFGRVPQRAGCGHTFRDATRTCAAATHSTNSRAGCQRPHRSLYRVPQTAVADFCRPW